LIRNTKGCKGGLGDSIAAYGYDFAPATVTINHTRMSGAARAAVAAFAGADVTLQGSASGSCNALVAPTGGGAIRGAASSLCECDGKWAACRTTSRDVPPALIGFPTCDPRVLGCTTYCFDDLAATQGAGVLAHNSMWSASLLSMETVVADSKGCGTRPYVPGFTERGAFFVKGSTPGAVAGGVQRPGSIVMSTGALVTDTALLYQKAVFPARPIPDLRNAAFIPFQACRPLDSPLTEPREVCFSGRGVDGLRAELLDTAGARLDAVWGSPAYFIATGALPDPALAETSTNGTGYFYDVPPGDYLVRLVAKDGRSLACKLDPTDSGSEMGVAEGPNTYRVHAEAGVNNLAVRAFCTVQ
jgi:hypothetical protein